MANGTKRRGSGSTPERHAVSTSNFTLRLDGDMKVLIEEIAAATDRTLSGFVKHAIKRTIDDYVRKGIPLRSKQAAEAYCMISEQIMLPRD
jgi:uncharacterized protein (DUF1778 family)